MKLVLVDLQYMSGLFWHPRKTLHVADLWSVCVSKFSFFSSALLTLVRSELFSYYDFSLGFPKVISITHRACCHDVRLFITFYRNYKDLIKFLLPECKIYDIKTENKFYVDIKHSCIFILRCPTCLYLLLVIDRSVIHF